MDGLTKFEIALGKLRIQWSKAEWRRVAHELAGLKTSETRGRKTKTAGQVNDSKQNLLAAEFWRDQNIDLASVFDGDVGTVQKRLRPLTQREATKALLTEALLARTEVTLRGDKLVKKTNAVVREIQVMQKNRREE